MSRRPGMRARRSRMGEGEVFARNFLASRVPPDAFEAAGADDSVHTKEWRAEPTRAAQQRRDREQRSLPDPEP